MPKEVNKEFESIQSPEISSPSHSLDCFSPSPSVDLISYIDNDSINYCSNLNFYKESNIQNEKEKPFDSPEIIPTTNEKLQDQPLKSGSDPKKLFNDFLELDLKVDQKKKVLKKNFKN